MSTESQLQDVALRLRVRQLIENGQLPVMLSEEIFGGYGSGRTCVACGQPITASQVEYEVEDHQDKRPLSFHMGCHMVWQLECARARTPLAIPP